MYNVGVKLLWVRGKICPTTSLFLPYQKFYTCAPLVYNHRLALKRTESTLKSLKKRKKEFDSALEKFSKNISIQHPRFIPVPTHEQQNTQGQAYWIPLFSVWQKGKSRIVFDSAAKVKTTEVCINDTLLKGPDRNNSLRGVLLRFRRHPYAVTADIENMFHQFAIPDHQRTYLRFFWYRDNDPNQQLIEWYSRVHLMGLRSSPAAANLGIRYSARKHPPRDGHTWIREDDLLDPYQRNRTRSTDDLENTLANNFYVDDFMNSQPTEESALEIINEGIRRFKRYELKLCKVRSNSPLVRNNYPPPESSSDIKEVNPNSVYPEETEKTSTLGLQWHIQEDKFTIKMEFKDRPRTKRGFLGYIMSPYDPFAIAAPAMLSCKLLQREIFPPKDSDPHCLQALGWDEPIPERFHKQWDDMIKTCQEIQNISVSRPFYPKDNGTPQTQQLFAFADASDLALCYAIYIRTETTNGNIYVTLISGSSKVLPKGVSQKGQLSIPRAELCAARDLAEQVLQVETDLDLPKLQPTRYFTDSQDVLAWINNKEDAKPRYIASRVNTICKISDPTQWQYIPTSENPADIGTRPISVQDLMKSMWFSGPQFLMQPAPNPPPKKE